MKGRYRNGLAIGVTVALAGVFVAAAQANIVTYIPWGTVFGPGSIGHSGWTGQGWLYNSFCDTPGVYGGNPYMGTTYLNTVQPPQPTVPWQWTGADCHYDDRQATDYVAAACGAKTSNQYRIFVDYCTAGNNSG